MNPQEAELLFRTTLENELDDTAFEAGINVNEYCGLVGGYVDCGHLYDFIKKEEEVTGQGRDTELGFEILLYNALLDRDEDHRVFVRFRELPTEVYHADKKLSPDLCSRVQLQSVLDANGGRLNEETVIARAKKLASTYNAMVYCLVPEAAPEMQDVEAKE